MPIVILLCVANSIVIGNAIDYAVRLNNTFGNSSKEGRLEIYYSGRWGTICDDGFTHANARVACASLGFGRVGLAIANRYGAGSDQIWLDDVNCAGSETGIEQCVHLPWGANNCGHGEDISISCYCAERNFSGSTGHISSPNFPMMYDINNDNCSYITVPSGQTVIITFLAFNLETSNDFVMITCASRNNYTSPAYSGSQIPSILTISACSMVRVYFHSDVSITNMGFYLTYDITSDIIVGGFTTQPSNAFPRSDKNDPVIFNCTTATKYLPWWTFNDGITEVLITHSTCGVISSMYFSSWFKAETTGPGSCNLIVTAPANGRYLLVGSFVCTDSTLASRRAIWVPIDLRLNSTKCMNSSKSSCDVVRDDEITISCSPSFSTSYPSLVFTYSLYSGGPFAQLRILRTYWTSEGVIVSSTGTSNVSSSVLVKAAPVIIPRYSCNVVFDFFSNFTDISDNFPAEMAISTEPVDILYWPTDDNITITGDSNGHIKTQSLLYCNVPANPPATYTWLDESNGKITKGPTSIIFHGGKYTCNASNVIRGQNYQVSKFVNVEVIEDDTNRLTIIAIILGVLLGAAVLIIIIILTIPLCRKGRQQKPKAASDVGHINHDSELRQIGGESNSYEVEIGNSVNTGITEYETLGESRRPASIYPDYEELDRGN